MAQFQWWCVAQQGAAWSWTWRPLLGVWALIALLVWWYRRVLRASPGDEPARILRLRRASFAGGLALLWAALDWPLGPLGASYLASVHMVAFLAVGAAAPPLLLLGFPPAAYARLSARPRITGVLTWTTQPVAAFFVFNVVMTATHWPSVVDALMISQFGSFAIDASWLLAGLIFWWPVVAPYPERPGFHPLAKIAYLGLNAFLIRPPFAMMIFTDEPIYRIYELAPPPAGDALDDQQFAGAVMKIGLAWIMFVGVLVLFRQWMGREERGTATQ